MKIEGDNSLEAGNYQQVRDQPPANRFPPVCPAILTRISEVGNYAGKTRCTCPPAGVSEEEQFHQVTVDRRTGRLNHVDVAAAHAFFYLCVQLGVGKTVQNRATDSGSEPFGNRVGKRRVSGAGYNNEIHVSPSANLNCSFVMSISRANLASSAGDLTWPKRVLKFNIGGDAAGYSNDPDGSKA
jgi:hypothetical protein